MFKRLIEKIVVALAPKEQVSALEKRVLEQIIPDSPPKKTCSECFSFIDLRARRCPYCTTVLIA